MNVRSAILAAADHIESNPQEFNFGSVRVPNGCGTPGCAIGWIGAYRGMTPHLCIDAVAAVGVADTVFYQRMHSCEPWWAIFSGWMTSARVCAATLRRYADKYHPATSDTIPAEVLAIFGKVAA